VPTRRFVRARAERRNLVGGLDCRENPSTKFANDVARYSSSGGSRWGSREPRMYRIPDDHTYNLRTTWLRTTKGWVQFENWIKWINLSPKTPKFEECSFSIQILSRPPRLFSSPILREMSGKIFGAASNLEGP
jgi:hypothetical protein